MKKLSEDIIQFLHRQGFVIVSTIDENGSLHSSCKGLVNIDKSGRLYLLDLYKKRTFENLKRNPRITATSVDEHKFKGFCLKGHAKIVKEEKLEGRIIKAWEQRISKRITQRVLKNMRGEKGHPRHPEVFFPQPEYMIVMQVEEIVNLTPGHITSGE